MVNFCQVGDIMLVGASLVGAYWDIAQMCLTTEASATRSLGLIRGRPGDIRLDNPSQP